MVEEHAGSEPASGDAPDLGWHPVGATPSAPGWYPDGTNPNEQAYWDGQGWTGRRHWNVTGWVEEGLTTPATGQASGAPRISANPYSQTYAPRSASRRRPASTTLSLGVLLLIVSGIALMYGSVGSWVHVTGFVGAADFHVSINGTDPAVSSLIGVNGYVTFVGGVVLLVFGGLALSSEEVLLAALTSLVAVVTLVFAVYDMFRIVQKITNVTTGAGANLGVGWGLICVLSAAVLATVVSLFRLVSR